MTQVTGVVETTNNNFGKFNMKVGGNWYNTKPEWLTVKPNIGDSVTFDNGGKNYISKLTINSSGGDVSASPSPSKSYSRGKFPIDVADGQRSIIRQNALTNARELYQVVSDSDDYDDSVALRIIEMARVFESYTAGDIEAMALQEMQRNGTDD